MVFNEWQYGKKFIPGRESKPTWLHSHHSKLENEAHEVSCGLLMIENNREIAAQKITRLKKCSYDIIFIVHWKGLNIAQPYFMDTLILFNYP